MHPCNQLLKFLNASPTAWHAVDFIKNELNKKGFKQLDEKIAWKIKPGKGYYVVRNESSIIAFSIPKIKPSHVRVSASHLDSPALKLKPNPFFLKEEMLMCGVDVYGSPLLSSWLNRDLGLAGRVFTSQGEKLVEKLVNVTHAPLVIPQLAIHLDREVNSAGLILNKQEHLAAIAAAGRDAKTYFSQLININPIISHDLFLYPLEPPAFIGPNQEMIAGYRIDSLASVHAILDAFITSELSDSFIKMSVFWDNEEIGSETSQGAASPFFSETLERILLALNMDREEYLRIIASSICVSVDLTHAVHPNYAERHEPYHKVYLGKGPVIKHSSQQRYATNAHTSGYIKFLCTKYSIPFQEIISRGDMVSGTTIGPIHANRTGMSTIDIGNPQLSMHSARELIAANDHINLIELLKTFYK